MYASLIASMLSLGLYGRDRRRPAGVRPDLSDLNDHTLRDIGMRREPPIWDRRHLMRF